MPSPTVLAPSLAVVICCYTDDRWSLLTGAIEAAVAQLHDADTLIVVVDHHDGLLARLSERYAAQPRVRPVASTQTPGLSGARNSAVALAAEDVVVFLDDDATLQPGSLDSVRAALADGDVVAIGGAVSPHWVAGAAPDWFPDEFGWVVGCDYRGLPPHGAGIRNPIGAAMAVRREPLVGIGGFSHRLGRKGTFPAGCEETLMGIALRRENPFAAIVRDTGFEVHHAVPGDRGTLAYFTRRCYQEGRSKAVLSRLSSTGEALSSERSYATRILTTGVWNQRRNPRRVLAMIIGFGCTAAGFVTAGLAAILPGRRREETS